jgi:hypothetical protein
MEKRDRHKEQLEDMHCRSITELQKDVEEKVSEETDGNQPECNGDVKRKTP